MDEIYCIFLGSLNNISGMIRQYGLTKGTNEAMLVIEAYRTLRDRSPYPAHQVLKELEGRFGFVVYDSKAKSVFASLVSLINWFIKIIHDISQTRLCYKCFKILYCLV